MKHTGDGHGDAGETIVLSLAKFLYSEYSFSMEVIFYGSSRATFGQWT